jgi:hypothetical protein
MTTDDFSSLLQDCFEQCADKEMKNVYAHAIQVLKLKGREAAEKYLHSKRRKLVRVAAKKK